MLYCRVSCLKVLCSPFFSLLLSSISESFLTVKGAALFLPRGNGSSPSSASRFSQLRSKHAGEVTGQQGETGRLAASHVSLTLIRVVFLFLHKETSSSIYKPCSRSSDRRTTSNWCVNTFTPAKLNLEVVDRLSRRSTLFYLIDPGGSVGERQRSDHPLHGGGLNQRAAGHGGERGAGNGLQSCR